jgi:flagellar M-ring protein FliF
MKPLLASLAALGPARLAALAGVGAATLGLLLFLAMRLSADGPMALLYGDLDLRDASAMADLLDKAHVPHEIGAGGSSILVPADRVAQARLDMAKAGLPGGGSIGYEIFDRGDGLTSSQFQQDINETRALEGELARSIRIMRGVRGVRVHLVLARHEPFAQEEQEAQASVLLTMSGAARMDRDGVQAVLNLVAAAVPGLKPQNIAIVDDRGELLARAGEPADGAAASQDEIRMATQTRLSHAVEEMLERSLGVGHVRAEAAVDMDFDHSSETDEKYDPDGQVARSTQSITDSSKSSQKDTPVSVQNNLPNPDAGAAASGSGSQDQHQEETTNYEIGKTVRTIVHDQPRIARITLAVMVDGITSMGAGGKPEWHERSADDLARIGTLARSVIGFDAKRGDTVDVVSMRFTNDAASLPASAPGLFGLAFGTPEIMRLVQMVLFGLVALGVVVMVLRPAALRLTASPAAQLTAQAMGAEEDGADPARLAGATAAPAGLLTDESMVSLNNIDGTIRASSIRRIAELVDKHPEESVAILRGWIAQEAG